MPNQAQVSSINSTIVRSDVPVRLRWIRRCFSVLERYAPGLGVLWATHLWFRQPQVPAAVRRRGLPRQWVACPFEVELNGSSVRGMSWGQGPTVYLVHGWGGWGLQLAGLVEPLVTSGYRVVTFDMPSHGASDAGRWGARASTLDEFVDAVKAVVASQGPAHAIVGHSMGATASAAALREGISADAAVFIAPMADPLRYTHGFARLLGFGERIRSRLQALIEHRVGLPMEYYNVPRMARDMRTPRLLVVHDRKDRETPWTDGQSIAEAWPQARLMSTEGLGHRRIVANAEVIAAVLAFIRASQDAAVTRCETSEAANAEVQTRRA